MGQIREIGVQEFVRRLKHAVDTSEDSRFTFFIGAGCSVTSGIPAAGALVKRWLRRLKTLKTGDGERLEDWIKETYPAYEEDNAAQFYEQVIEELFFTSEERQREIESLTEGKDPGFGYAVLAQLMTHERHGRHCSAVLTVNFDDLVADALYLYTQRKPLVISHESLASFIRVTRTRPLVIKLHGDARLEPKNTTRETKDLDDNVKTALKNFLPEMGLIFLGYGGYDKSIAAILNELPRNSLRWGIYWINSELPDGPMGKWLEGKDAIWVKHRDFDELMVYMLDGFDLSHPEKKRFDDLMETYTKTFARLAKKGQLSTEEGPRTDKADELSEALRRATERFKSWQGVWIEASLYEKSEPQKADAIYQEGIEKFPDSADLLEHYASFLTGVRKDYDQAEAYYKRALAIEPDNTGALNNYALILTEVRRDHDQAEAYYKRALAIEPDNARVLGNYAIILTQVRRDHDQAEAYYKRSVAIEPDNARVLGNYASFLKNVRKDYDQAEEYYMRALEIEPADAKVLNNYASFLKDVRRDHGQAETYYKRALGIEPDNAAIIGNYAGLLIARGDESGFDLLNKAMELAEGDPSLVSLLLECHYYRYAHSEDSQLQSDSLQEIKRLLEEGVRSPYWDFTGNVTRAIEDGHPHPEFLEPLSKVISEETDIQELADFDVWRDA